MSSRSRKQSDNLEVKEITKTLDAIASILLEFMNVEGKKPSMRKRIELLHASGLKPTEIARIVRRTSMYVNVVLSQRRKE